MTTPSLREDPMSQLPAVELLVKLGWEYLTPAEAVALRGGRRSSGLLESVLREQVAKLNRVRHRDGESPLSEGAVEEAVDAVRSVRNDGLIPTNHALYDLLCLGKSVEQVVNGQSLNPQVRYFEFDPTRLHRNVFQVTEEFEVVREGREDTRRPDLVLFVNGIPLAVIECKSPVLGKKAMPEAISQQIRNQKHGEIPQLYWTSQLLLALSGDQARYGTTGTPEEFWSEWKEPESRDPELLEVLKRPLSSDVAIALESVPNKIGRHEALVAREAEGRYITNQDRLLYALCRPERVMEIFRRFVVFDAGVKKVPRYPQYFAVHRILDRVREIGPEGRREGGVVWHTQGSGKSLTMVMLAKNLALHPAIPHPRIVLVTDRVELDKQIRDTFQDCGIADVKRAASGKHLRDLIREKHTVVTTILDKFEGALKAEEALDDDPNLFVLVDESHRSQHGRRFAGQFGTMHRLMRKALPNACYLGFTGTPLKRGEKSTARQFGGIIDRYTIDEAVADRAVLPLLYEGRLIDQDVDQKQIDLWFERLTRNRSEAERAELKRKFATAGHLHKAEERMRQVAWDVSVHFDERFKGTGLKGQLVADSRLSAIRYQTLLDEIGMVTSAVLISKSDDREDHTSTSETEETEVQRFWERMMREHGTEEQYNENLVTAFKGEGAPDLIIVCNKLLTGFDAPRNTALYLDRPLKDHGLLQAIARVNRKFPGKDFGYVMDYRGVLEELDTALRNYTGEDAFDSPELMHTVRNIAEEIDKLPEHHQALLSVFAAVKNRGDLEEYVDVLREESARDSFVECLRTFARTLEIALSSLDWEAQTPAEIVKHYRDDLKFFEDLRRIVRQRFSEEIDYREYGKQMQKLIDRHVGSDAVRQITPLVNIFNKEAFDAEVEKVASPAAKADTIAHRTAKTLTERMDEDPTFYQRLSRLLQKTIADYEAKRIQAAEYLKRAREVAEEVRTRGADKVPPKLRDNPPALAFYHTLKQALLGSDTEVPVAESAGFTALSLKLDKVFAEQAVVDWQRKPDAQNTLKNAMEDELLAAFDQAGREVSLETLDRILDTLLQSARHHYSG